MMHQLIDSENKCDYEIPYKCVFPLSDDIGPEYAHDCGEPATHYVWWDVYDRGWHVCAEHFSLIWEQEKTHESDT